MPICSIKTKRESRRDFLQPASRRLRFTRKMRNFLLSQRAANAHLPFPQSVTTICLAARARWDRARKEGFNETMCRDSLLLIAPTRTSSRDRIIHGAHQTAIALLGNSIICCTSSTASNCVFVLEKMDADLKWSVELKDRSRRRAQKSHKTK